MCAALHRPLTLLISTQLSLHTPQPPSAPPTPPAALDCSLGLKEALGLLPLSLLSCAVSLLAHRMLRLAHLQSAQSAAAAVSVEARVLGLMQGNIE